MQGESERGPTMWTPFPVHPRFSPMENHGALQSPRLIDFPLPEGAPPRVPPTSMFAARRPGSLEWVRPASLDQPRSISSD